MVVVYIHLIFIAVISYKNIFLQWNCQYLNYDCKWLEHSLSSGFVMCPLNSRRSLPRVCSTTDSSPPSWLIQRQATPSRLPRHAPLPVTHSPSPLPDHLNWPLDDMTERELNRTYTFTILCFSLPLAYDVIVNTAAYGHVTLWKCHVTIYTAG